MISNSCDWKEIEGVLVKEKEKDFFDIKPVRERKRKNIFSAVDLEIMFTDAFRIERELLNYSTVSVCPKYLAHYIVFYFTF